MIIIVYSVTSRRLHFQAVIVLSFLVHCCPGIFFFSLAFSSTYEEIDSKNVMYRKFTLCMVFPVTKIKIYNNYKGTVIRSTAIIFDGMPR